MKKLIILLFLLSVNFLSSQTLMPIGPQVTSFSGMIRGYHFTAPVNFTICGLRIPPDAPGAAGQAQEIRVVRFTAGAPPAFPGITNSFVQLFSSSGAASGATVACNIPVSAGSIIGIYGSVGSSCINSYDGVAFATNILGSPTTLLRSGMQSCPWGGAAMSNIWSEVGYDVGRIQMFYNCCPSPTVTSIASPTSICPGQSSNLTAGGAGVGGTYTWSPAGGAGSPVVVSPTVTTTYSVTGTTSLGCTGTSTVQVVVNPSPTITPVVSPAAICVGKSSTVTLSGASTYTTNTGNIVGSPVVLSPVATTIYTATGTSSLGCVNTNTFQVIVNPLPVVTPGSNSPICSGGTLNLTVGAASSYSWTGPLAFTSNIQNPSVSNVTAPNAGVYTASVTDASGCIGSGTVNVVVNPQPVISPTNGGPYCIGATINLSVAAYNTYTWTGPNGFTSNLQNPAIVNGQLINAGIYTVSVTAVGGCMSTGTTNVIVNSLPTPTASSNSPVCVGQPINFSGTGGATYTWTGPGGYTSTSQNPVIASAQATDAGTYTLTVTNANSCVNFTTTNLVINPLPVIVVNNPTVCVNQSINLTSNGGSTYTWTGPGGYTSNSQNPTITNASTLMTGSYTVLVATAAGCTNNAVSSVSVITLPTPGILSNTPCVGSTLSFTGSGGTSYAWAGPNGLSSASQNPTIPNVSLAANGVYSLIVTAGTCSNSTTAPVLINPLPAPTATNNSPVCVNTAINFTGTGGTTYTWTGPGGYTSNTQNPVIASAQATDAGTYTLTVTNANGCVNFTTTNVVVNPLPVIVVTNPTVCVNQNINLSANGGATYAWSGPLGYSSNLQAPTIVSSNTTMSGGYTVVVTTASGCTASAVSNVSVYPLPTPAIISNTPCAGSTLSLTGSGGAAYSWSGPNGFSSVAQNPTIPNVSLAANGVYTLIATAGTCSNSITAPVLINALPVPTATSNSAVCVNQTINFTGTGGTTYTWTGPGGYTSTSQNPPIALAQATNAGTYTLTVTDVNGCVNFTTTNVVVNPLPVIVVTNPTVCVNQNINLSANGGATYAWSGPLAYTSSAQNPVIINATTSMTGPYNVLVTTAAGCTASAVSNVSVITLPVPVITSNTPCVGSTLTFTGSGGSIYSWSGPNGFSSASQNPTIPNVSLAANGVYSLTVTAGTCSNFTTAPVLINALPVPTATSNSAVCVNQTINFTGTGGATYTWTGPGGYTSTSQNPPIALAQATNAGTYTLTVTDVNGCVNFTTTNVVVNPLPVIVVTNPTACVNQNINLSANGGVTYAWSGPLGYTSALQNPVITNATTPMTGPYNVLVTTAMGCTQTAVSNVSVIALPVPSISSNTPCVGATLNLTGNGGTGYVWTGPNGFNSAAQNPSIPNVSLAANGVYSLTVTVGMCSNFTVAPVLINPLPTPNITSNGPVCLNQPATFTASGANSYSWSGPNGFTGTGSTIGIASSSNLNAGTYVVTATDLNNCSNTASYQLVVNPLPVIAAVGSTVCANQNITLSATGGNIFVWNGPVGYTSNTQFPVIPNASLGMAGTYTVTVTDINGCTSASLTNVVVNSIPSPTISSNSPICVNQTITLSSGAPTGVSYIWSGPNGFLANGQNQQIKPATPVNSGIYMVTVSDNIGCAASVSVNMIVNPLPNGNVVSTGTAGCIPLCVTFTCQAPTPLQFCSWDFGYGANASGSVANNCYTRDGAFKVTAYYTDINGCSNTSTYAVNPYPIPTADYNFAPQRPVEGEPVDFTNSSYGPGITGYSWYFSNLTNTVITEHNPSMVFQTPGGYAVALVVMNDKGCSDTIVRAVMVEEDYGLYVPNAFTPNGDGLNDVFYPKGFGIAKYELNIFDRWGEKIFSTNKFEEGWAGNYAGRNDEPVQSDVYVWLIKFVNPKGKAIELTGKVLLSK